MRYLFLTFLALASTLAAAPDRHELADRLYAVHATDRLPVDAVLHPNMHWEDTFEEGALGLIPQVRYTVHFALGELVRPIGESMSWEHCRYAVVTPLRTLLPQLLNLNCYDSFILGDFHFARQSIVVLPKGTPGPLPARGSLFWYDSQRQSLREAVEMCLSSLGAWQIEMNDDHNEDELRPALLGDVDVNTPEFFAALLDYYPYITHGLRFVPHDGEHWRLSQLEKHFLGLLKPLFDGAGRIYVSPEMLEDFEEGFYIWRHSVEGCRLGADALQALADLEAEVEAWLRIGNAELCLQQDEGLTLVGLPLEVLRELSLAARDDDELAAVIALHHDLLQSVEERAA